MSTPPDGLAAILRTDEKQENKLLNSNAEGQISDQENPVISEDDQANNEKAKAIATKAASILSGRKFSNRGNTDAQATAETLRLLNQMKHTVTRLDASEAEVAPLVRELEIKVRGLVAQGEETYPNVQMLLGSYETVTDTVDEIKSITKGMAELEEEKWKSHEAAALMERDKVAAALAACLQSKDLVKERARVDGRIAALKLDLESTSSDQMRILRSLMGGEVGKVVAHVGSIKASFDAALGIMAARIDAVKDEFQQHRDEALKERESAAALDRRLAEARVRQDEQEDELRSLKAALARATAAQGAELEVLSAEVGAVASAGETNAEAVALLQEEGAAFQAEARGRAAAMEQDTAERLAAAAASSEAFTVARIAEAKAELAAAAEALAADDASVASTLLSRTGDLQQQLNALNSQRACDVEELSERIDEVEGSVFAAAKRQDDALLKLRDDAQASTERCVAEATVAAAAQTDATVAALQASVNQDVASVRSAVAAAAAAVAGPVEGRLVALETQAAALDHDHGRVKAAFEEAERARGRWQASQAASVSSFKASLDAHLQGLEELLNEKVSLSRVDVVRLGRSNVALAALLHQTRARLGQLATQEESVGQWTARVDAHAEAVAAACTKAEGGASVEKAFALGSGLVRTLGSAAQRVAELLSLLADNATVRQVLLHPNPADQDLGWDRRVDATRDRSAREWVAKVYGLVASAHPSVHPVTLEARTAVFSKLELALKIALSKHQSVLPTTTILGRRPLDSCAACNRPMTKHPEGAGSGTTGSGAIGAIGGTGGGPPPSKSASVYSASKSSTAGVGDRRSVPATGPLPGGHLRSTGAHLNTSSWSPDRSRPSAHAGTGGGGSAVLLGVGVGVVGGGGSSLDPGASASPFFGRVGSASAWTSDLVRSDSRQKALVRPRSAAAAGSAATGSSLRRDPALGGYGGYGGGGPSQPEHRGGGALVHQSEGPYVLRGGFRMPKKPGLHLQQGSLVSSEPEFSNFPSLHSAPGGSLPPPNRVVSRPASARPANRGR